jgi:hypothetical protein
MINKSHPLMMEVTKKIASSLASMLYHFFYMPHKKNDESQLDERTIMDLGILARRLAYRDPTAHFKLVIEYTGIPKDKDKLGLFLAPSMYKIIAENFVKWAGIVFSYEVSEDEKRKISETHIDQLTPETKQYYDLFNKTLPLYTRLWGVSTKESYEKLSQLGLQ